MESPCICPVYLNPILVEGVEAEICHLEDEYKERINYVLEEDEIPVVMDPVDHGC